MEIIDGIINGISRIPYKLFGVYPTNYDDFIDKIKKNGITEVIVQPVSDVYSRIDAPNLKEIYNECYIELIAGKTKVKLSEYTMPLSKCNENKQRILEAAEDTVNILKEDGLVAILKDLKKLADGSPVPGTS